MTVTQRAPLLQRTRLLGPAFVAAVAYVDPGNVATNTAAGARHGYLLLWVLVSATAMAALVQYLSAKVGWLTGETLPALVARRAQPDAERGGPGARLRLAYWAQAELVAMATDLAEIVGGAIALQILFGLPSVAGAALTAAVSTVLLLLQDRRSQRMFERVVGAMLAIVTCGFLAGLALAPPDPAGMAAGLVPRLQGAESALLAVGMLGATVMPHAVYLHSALIRDRHGAADAECAQPMLRTIRLDVVLAMLVAGSVNVGMLLLAASTLHGSEVDSIAAAHAGLSERLGPWVAAGFALALLASGLASTAVGGYAGSVIMAGLLHKRIPVLWRRVITAVPALLILSTGVDSTWLLIVSQVVLSFGLPFALVPLVRIAGDPELMRLAPTKRGTVIAAWLVVALVSSLNLLLVAFTLLGV